MKKPHIVCFLGVGGVGKTSVLEELNDNRQDLPFSFSTCPSPTRLAYSKLGLSTESEALALPLEQKENFQTVVYETYKEVVSAFVADNQHVDVLIFDRSAYDYASYQLVSFPNWSVQKVRNLEVDVQRFYASTFRDHAVSHFYFPFPAPWLFEDTAYDDFRYRPHAKNYVWDSSLKRLFKDWSTTLDSYRTLPASLSAGARAELVISHLTDNIKVTSS